MLRAGVELIVLPEKPVAGGAMLARHDGRIILVRGAIPGEAVRVRIERVSKGVGHAVALAALAPHADRREPPVDPACGGNAFAHIAYARQLTLKGEIVADAFARIGGVALDQPVRVTGSPERGFRMRARFHVHGPRAGFYREGTHDLCDAATSGQLQPAAAAAAQAVVDRALALGVSPHEIAGIELAETVGADGRAVHVELRGPSAGLRFADPGGIEGLTGLSWSIVSDPRTHIVFGTPYVTDALDIRPLGPAAPGAPGAVASVVQVTRHVRSFFQANRYLISDLVDAVRSLAAPGPVVDLYAGVGLFAVACAASRRDEVVAVEGDGTSARDLAANAAASVHPFAAHHLSVETFLAASRALPPGPVLVDPPRTGLSRAAAAGLLRHAPPQIVYVSCDVATLARDVKVLREAGYRLTHVEAFDLFPVTAHVENVAVLER